MSWFCHSIHNHPNSIMTLRRSRQFWNKIHNNFLRFHWRIGSGCNKPENDPQSHGLFAFFMWCNAWRMIYFKPPKYIVNYLRNWRIKLIEKFSITWWWFLENSGVMPGVQATLGGEPRVCSILLLISLVSTQIPFANQENCITKSTTIIQWKKKTKRGEETRHLQF